VLRLDGIALDDSPTSAVWRRADRGAFGSGAALFIPFIAQFLKTADYRPLSSIPGSRSGL
jgi:hypothetical protein